MMRTLSLVLLLNALASCNGVECGDGTFMAGDQCVGYDPNDQTAPVTMITPAGGRSRAELPSVVMLMTDEPATVFYTTNGSDPDPTSDTGETSPVTVVGITQGMTIKYLAVDRAGNAETVKSTTYDSDTEAPGQVSGFAVDVTGAVATVSWSNPIAPDYAGTVLARVRDVIDQSPTPGQTYTGASTLSPSVEIVTVGTGTQFVDPNRPPGIVRYVAWTFDDLGNYSTPVAVSGAVALGATTAQLTFVTSTSTLTVAQSPASFALTGTTGSLNGTTLTISLSFTNNSTQYFQNPKIEVVSTTNATFSGADGTADALPFKTLGPEMLAPGATAVRNLVFTGATATATINLKFASHPSMLFMSGRNGSVGQQGIVDLGSNQLVPSLTLTVRGPNDRLGGRVRPGVITGGHFLDVPTSHGAIERYDLVTRTRVGGVDLGDGERLNVQALVNTGSDLIAVMKRAGHRRSGELELVRLDEGLHVVQTVKPMISMDRGFARPALSADGSTLAVPVRSGILLVDVRTMELIDALPSTPHLDLVDPGFVPQNGGGGGSAESAGVQFFNGSNGLVVVSRRDGQAAIIQRDEAGYSSTLYQDADTGSRGFGAAVASDGKIWMAFDAGIRAYNPTTDSVAPVGYGQQPLGLGSVDGRMWVIRNDRNFADEVTTSGAVVRTLSPTNGAYGHWFGIAK